MGNELLTGFLAGQGDNNGKNNGSFFGNEGLWAVIILAIIFGWGRNGFGGNNGDGANNALPYLAAMGTANQGALTRADLMSEFGFNGLENSVRGVQQGLCDGFYAMNTSTLNGFHGVDNAICTLGYNMQQGFNGVERGQSDIMRQISECCCENGRATERGFAEIGYRMATDTCAINTNASNNTRDIIDAVNCGFRGINDRLTSQEIAAKDAQIAAQNQRIFGLELAASQSAQNQYLISQLGQKAPVPSFNVPAPWQYQNNSCCGNY